MTPTGPPPAGNPKKRFGQHFLKDPNTARIVCRGVTGDDVVLEVGPGRGFLTGFLLEQAGYVHAVEIDDDVLPYLKDATAGAGNLAVHRADALRFDHRNLAPTPNKLIANLPYNIASPLVLRLLEEAPDLGEMRFMVQLEVAKRMAAGRGTKDYGSYAVLIQLLAVSGVVHKVPPTVFDPPPRVYSAVVELKRRESSLVLEEYAEVKRLVLAAFATRRKRLVKNLEAWGRSVVAAVLREIGYGENVRAEELAPEDFVRLYRGILQGRESTEVGGETGMDVRDNPGVVLLRAHAKVNYTLEITGVRDDGYHELRSVFQSISLHDDLSLTKAGSGFSLKVEPPGADVGPSDENTIHRAWRLLSGRVGRELSVAVELTKRIPAGAGVGGGSADAAAFLVGANELFSLGLSEDELREVAVGVGADVPFCISGGTALGEGVGEKLSALPPPPEHYIALVKPEASASTAEVYRAYDSNTVESKGNSGPVMAALLAGSLTRLASSIGNDLAPLTARIVPELAEYERVLLASGAIGTAMSGSGTVVYGIFWDEQSARVALASEPLTGVAVGVYRPVGFGVEIIRGR
ncbi:16S rRNA (adenine(1518)-N(6)/adenine(1519)-N(6))-dimethyltransferase RsmA [Rubrobacter indicoceani]|uniref:16S rRNA (adenine(1518)-N(6)/adenine(1519)-N(6))- dimethyltransferase RsmA n=1 Tax=Rubrobacter indicoceani TaxID=2051957 RepID=UPI000E5B8185|nr:16S rRNA (adenine(1518)-N(6)/adenine(1519)-N(6))-dimethyltransferase RsmA [Rubrobacter indicoceani]